jgi:hypothetical protein
MVQQLLTAAVLAIALTSCSPGSAPRNPLSPDLAAIPPATACRCDQLDYAVLGCDAQCSTTHENVCERPGCLCIGRMK